MLFGVVGRQVAERDGTGDGTARDKLVNGKDLAWNLAVKNRPRGSRTKIPEGSHNQLFVEYLILVYRDTRVLDS